MSVSPSYKEVPDFTDCVIGWDWEEPTHILYDARHWKRASAIRTCADTHGIDFKEATCTTTYARWLTRQEIWEDGAGELWWDNQGEMVNGSWVPADDEPMPDEPPEDWEPDPERDGIFTLCDKDAPGAVKVWMVATGL